MVWRYERGGERGEQGCGAKLLYVRTNFGVVSLPGCTIPPEALLFLYCIGRRMQGALL